MDAPATNPTSRPTPAAPHPWLVRAGLIALWLGAYIPLVRIDILIAPSGGQSAFAAIQVLSLITLALAVVFIALARHRLELGWPVMIAAVAVALQAGSAWLRPSGVTITPLPPATPLPPLGPNPASAQSVLDVLTDPTLLAAGATAALLALLLLHAAWILTPGEANAPFRKRLRAALRGLAPNPVTLLFGPVFQKEVRVAGRRRITYVARAAYPLLLLGIVGFSYAVMTSELQGYSGAERLQRLQDLAPRLAMVIAWCQFAVLAFIAPVMTGPAICDERRQLTLAALMTTPMTSSQIIFGKLTSRLVMIVILALVSTPLLLAVRVYGGLDAEIIVATTAISLSAAVLGASLGLLYSVWHRRGATAAVFGLLSMFLLMLVVIVIVIVTMMRTNLPPDGWVFGLSAPMAMVGATMAIFEPPPNVGDATSFLREIWITNTLVNLGLAAFICSAATLALRSVLRAEAAGALNFNQRSKPRRRRSRRGPTAAPPTAADPDAPADPEADAPYDSADDEASLRTAEIRTVGDRPVLWREVRQASFGSRRRLIIVAVAVALGALFIYSRVSFRDDALHILVGMIGLFVLILQACVITTASIAGEFESRTWQVLLTTPLSPREIVAGKFIGGLRRQWFIAACLAAHFLIALVGGYIHPLAVVHMAMIFTACAVMFTGTGVLLSLLFRKSTAASVCNLLLPLGLWLILPIGASMIMEFMDLYGNGADWYLSWLMSINPFALGAISLEEATGQYGGAWSRTLQYSLPHDTVNATTFTAIVAAASAAGVAVGLGCAGLTILLFRRLGGRAS